MAERPTVPELLEEHDFFDAAIMRHGFTDYMRDYEVLISGRNGAPWTDVHRYLFVGCAEAHCQTRVIHFAQSLSDDFVFSGPDYPDKPDPDGFIWGVRYSVAYPGLTYIRNGKRARFWSEKLGTPLHEVTIESEAFHLRLVFAEVRYAFLGHEGEIALPPRQEPIP